MNTIIPGTKEYMLHESYWINKLEPDNKPIMSPEEILKYNNKVIGFIPSMNSINDYSSYCSKEILYNLITSYKIPDSTRYSDNGLVISQTDYDKILANTNLHGLKQSNKVTFGISVNSTRLRSFPTEIGCYKENTSIEFDRFQETECPALEPVAVLHISKDGQWYFIQMYNYIGWVKAIDIALCYEKSEITDYFQSENFVMVVGNRAITQYNHYNPSLARREFYMGTRIPTVDYDADELYNQSNTQNYVVKLPIRNKYGMLAFGLALMSKQEPVHIGYLDYTYQNLIKQAFVLLGDRYDWGNKNNGRDCSSYVMYIYRTMGIDLPRNADEQENCTGIKHIFGVNDSLETRVNAFRNFMPGTLIFMDGHVMMYLGMDENKPYMIHDFHRYSSLKNDNLVIHNVNQVDVTSTLLNMESGNMFINAFTSLLLPKV